MALDPIIIEADADPLGIHAVLGDLVPKPALE
jgi:hypothetical protein